MNTTTLGMYIALMTAALMVGGSLGYSSANAVGENGGSGGIASPGGSGGFASPGGIAVNGTHSNGTNVSGGQGANANGLEGSSNIGR
jgi:hypothetical protein